MSDFEKEFAKEMKREKLLNIAIWGAVFVFAYFTTNDKDLGNAKLFWVIMGSTALLLYRMHKLEELILKVFNELKD